jgi:hypothetical protein
MQIKILMLGVLVLINRAVSRLLDAGWILKRRVASAAGLSLLEISARLKMRR